MNWYVGPLARSIGVLAHQPGEDRARLLPGVGLDVEPLEEVAVSGVGLDLRLRGRAGQRERPLDDALRAADLDQLAAAGGTGPARSG